MTKERNIFEILSILDRRNKPMTSKEITGELNDLGIPLTSRMIRHYFQQLDNEGFTVNLGKQGRKITEKGRDELRTSFVYARSDFLPDKIARMITETKFDVDRQRGEVIVNLSLIDENQEQKVRGILGEICQTKLFPQLVKIAHSGERLCNREVPEGKIGLVTISSITIDEILLNNCIHKDMIYGLFLEYVGGKPIKCTNLISVNGVSFDPCEFFISKKAFAVYDAVTKNHGVVVGDYKEIPYTARAKVIFLLRKVVDVLGGTIMVGRHGVDVLGVHPREGYIGIVVICGESLPAALEERGIETNTLTVESAINFKELEPIAPVRGEVFLL